MCRVHYNKDQQVYNQRQNLKNHLGRKRKQELNDFDFLVAVELGILDEIDIYTTEIEIALQEYYDSEKVDDEALLLALLAILREIYQSTGEYIHTEYSRQYNLEPDSNFELLILPFLYQRQEEIVNTIVSSASRRDSSDLLRRARVIASTEIGVAQSIAERLTMERVNSQRPLKKYWVGNIDDRIRDNHLSAAQTYNQSNAIWFNEMFLVGGEWMRYPRDSMASAKNTINCRCYVSYIEV